MMFKFSALFLAAFLFVSPEALAQDNQAVPRAFDTLSSEQTPVVPAPAAPFATITPNVQPVDPCAAYAVGSPHYVVCQDRHAKIERLRGLRAQPAPAVGADEVNQQEQKADSEPKKAEPQTINKREQRRARRDAKRQGADKEE